MTPRRKLRILVAEHKDRQREVLRASLTDSLAVQGVIAECEPHATAGAALESLRTRRYDAVVTDWRWTPDVNPIGLEEHDLGHNIASRAKKEDVRLVVVVTREKDLLRAAEADPDVDRVFLWEELHGGSDTLATYLVEALIPMSSVPRSVDVDPRRVFVVYGHAPEALKAMTRFLEDLDLRVLTFGDARALAVEQMRDEGRPVTTYDVVDFATRRAAAVVCLLTPDEAVKPARGAKRATEVRPRPNVIFEAGLAMARQPAKTLLVKVGDTSSWSDVDGVQYATFSNVPEQRDELVDWLESFQLPIDRRRGEWRTKRYGLPDYSD